MTPDWPKATYTAKLALVAFLAGSGAAAWVAVIARALCQM